MLRLYNTLTKKKEEFKSIKDKQVGMYCCGPTVYNYAHIGNLRSYVFEDILRRTLEYNGYKVKHVVNITDVGHLTSDQDEGEDKLEKGAKREGKSVWEIAEFYTKKFKEDIKKLNIEEPTKWPKATKHIKEQINLAKILEKKGFTYETDDGIYFDTSKLKDYGKLANLNIKGLQAGKRIDVKEKKNKTDFALWKFSPKDEKRAMEWKSPWGVGFPGWHLECSAMSMKYLGEQFDIHCGGIDHIPIHHTNEIAQSEAATGKKPWVKYWLHNEFLVLDKEKMAKSGKGFITLSKIEEKGYNLLAYRYFLLTAHYKQQLTFSWKGLDAAQSSFNKLKRKILDYKNSKDSSGDVKKYEDKFLGAINDDLNTPKALAVVWELIKDKKIGDKLKYKTLLKFDKVLGFDLKNLKENKLTKEQKELIKKREDARKNKNWKTSDEIRDELKKQGITLFDTPDGVRWEYD